MLMMIPRMADEEQCMTQTPSTWLVELANFVIVSLGLPQAACVATWAAHAPKWTIGASGPSARLALTEQQVPTHLHTANGIISSEPTQN